MTYERAHWLAESRGTKRKENGGFAGIENSLRVLKGFLAKEITPVKPCVPEKCCIVCQELAKEPYRVGDGKGMAKELEEKLLR